MEMLVSRERIVDGVLRKAGGPCRDQSSVRLTPPKRRIATVAVSLRSDDVAA